ncbi:MAG TPA: DnaJ domain-containing protein [Bryobacteraceae bacterium]|nr:DnaJ domain-containing protein [Bryobacteraceae bacterium]
MSSADLQHVTLGIPPSNPHPENVSAADYYEILRVAPYADEDTIERVYHTLADRFHPDNPSTGDQETFLRLREAYETLSDRAERAKYNVMRREAIGATRFRLRGREFFDGVRGGQNRRLAVLCLLYRQRIKNQDSAGLSILDLEQLTGCTREEITAALWYLCEKKWATLGEFTTYSITADGFDFVERKLEDRLEFRALATWSYYDGPVEPEDPASQSSALPLDIEPALSHIARNGHFGRAASEGDTFTADHYEILGIGPRADEEVIERVYSTLAGRFHPDNPSTGDARTFLRIQEAYETLSDPAKRRAYDALRDRTRHTERFRLRGREFFDGIKGEQLRRLAVLCLLYRQAAGELPGLTVLDLEKLTGCTREELGSALWYLREKKWAKYGEFTEYSITAAGFDVVENKLDEREVARSRAWLVPEDAAGQKIIAVTPHALIASADVPENLNSDQVVNGEQAEIKAEQPSDVIVEVAPTTPPFEQAPSIAEEFALLEVGAEAEVQSRLSVPVTLQALMASADEAAEKLESDQAVVGDQGEIKAEEPSHIIVEVSQGPTPIEEAARIVEEFARFKGGAEAAPEAPAANISATNVEAEELPDARDEQAAAPESAPIEEVSRIAESFARLEAGEEAAPEAPVATAEAAPVEEASPIAEEFAQSEAGTRAAPASISATDIQTDEPAATPLPTAIEEAARIAKAFARLEVDIEVAAQALAAKISATNIQAEAFSDEQDDQPAVAPVPTPIEKAHGVTEQVTRLAFPEPPRFLTSTEIPRSGSLGRFVRRLLSFADGPIAESQLNLRITAASPIWKSAASEKQNSQIAEVRSTELQTTETPGEQLAAAPESSQPEGAAAPTDRAIQFEVDAEPFAADQPPVFVTPQPLEEDVEVTPEPIAAPAESTTQLDVDAEPFAADQPQAQVMPETLDTKAEGASNEGVEIAPKPIAMQEAPGIAEPVSRLDGRVEAEVPNPWAWLIPEDIAYPQTPHSIAKSEQTDIKAEEPAKDKAEIGQGPALIEQASGVAEEVTRVELSAKTPAQSQQDVLVAPQSPGVSEMNDSKNAIAKQAGSAAMSAAKRVILSMGGKGGVGKTSVMTGLAEWFDANQIAVNLLDLDTENKAKGSLTHFFGGRVPKINIHTPAGLDAFVDLLAEDAPVILADMGAGAGKVTHDWFDKMYPDVAEAGVVFTAVGVVTSDPASVESVVNWSAALQDRVTYVIVENCLTEHADFSYWQENDLAEEFRKRFRPAIIRMDYRLAELENATRNYGVTLGRVASRSVTAPELQKASLVMRAQSYRRRMFAEFDKVKELLLP